MAPPGLLKGAAAPKTSLSSFSGPKFLKISMHRQHFIACSSIILLEFSNFVSCGNSDSISLWNLSSLVSHMLVIVVCLQVSGTATTHTYCVSLVLHCCNFQ